ncbi:MAG: enoyl-CoA hydratase/isomerase family protein [Ancrocorticia sp.]|jgi:2-(1,2-epoxy-1,2-dihydrophenyl)acetyl-CoA isomerase|nr:enoyl-CoA hydratase/isomerase family protein [Ancrocorticia sp.]MCI1896642.1 enoyl-CoA hydratase/isomerase family protein [Ancrocorticia sp.]MCI1933282.1 enoyl-CoA hydratase/isomerase family protein [Ancrocorticia sp.]MCI2013301.1 enoyl-CoA hydratase/isomerase family protein [Ancrocorticia sp.]MCI2030052.1 enoyl-CoA hydratase/isomerase family protein [Ancrocorticia sp.]
MGSVTSIRGDDGVAWVVLSQPRKKNALTAEMMDQLSTVLQELDDSADVRAIVVRGEGRTFSSGGDMSQGSGSTTPLADGRAMLGHYVRAIRMMRSITTPVIAMADGYVIGGAFSLLLAADLVCVAESVRAIPAFCAIGIAPEMGMSLLLPAAVGEHRAKEILFFNEELGAARLLELGIANRVFLPEDLEESTGELARKLAQVPRQSVAATKVIMNQAVTSQLDMVMAAETSASPLCAGIIRETEESAKR